MDTRIYAEVDTEFKKVQRAISAAPLSAAQRSNLRDQVDAAMKRTSPADQLASLKAIKVG